LSAGTFSGGSDEQGPISRHRARRSELRFLLTTRCQRCAMKRELRTKSVGTKVSEAELRVLESRAERAGVTLSEWVRDVLLGSSVEMGTMAAERAILAEVLGMRTII